MKIKPFVPQNCIHSSEDAKKIFFKNSGRHADFRPFIINFHNGNEVLSSICWKGDDISEGKYAVISAFSIPKDIIKDFNKTEYFLLEAGDTMILNGRIITVEMHGDEYLLMELPFVADEHQASSIGKTLTGKKISGLFWHLAKALKDDEFLCYIWVCLCKTDRLKGLAIPVFAEDQCLKNQLNDLDVLNIQTELVANNGIYLYHCNNGYAELEFICSTPQGLPS